MVTVAPQLDLVTRFDPQLGPELVRDDDLPLRTDSRSHTSKYNRPPRVPGGREGPIRYDAVPDRLSQEAPTRAPSRVSPS